MKFKGDIIITDPCYIIPNTPEYDRDWEKCSYGEDMEALGFTNCITSDTYYGDWSCTVYEMIFEKLEDPKVIYDIGEEIGEFCADAGKVGVFLLDEVLKYNPDFDYHIEKPWTTTLIKDFDGYVDFEFTEEYDENIDDLLSNLIVVGKGNINFVGYQTGL